MWPGDVARPTILSVVWGVGLLGRRVPLSVLTADCVVVEVWGFDRGVDVLLFPSRLNWINPEIKRGLCV